MKVPGHDRRSRRVYRDVVHDADDDGVGDPDRELFEYVCQQSNYAHELMVGTFEKVDRSEPIVP